MNGLQVGVLMEAVVDLDDGSTIDGCSIRMNVEMSNADAAVANESAARNFGCNADEEPVADEFAAGTYLIAISTPDVSVRDECGATIPTDNPTAGKFAVGIPCADRYETIL